MTIVISDPHLTEETLTYKVKVLDRTLFIDPFGRPLSPVSVAGVRCHDRRSRIISPEILLSTITGYLGPLVGTPNLKSTNQAITSSPRFIGLATSDGTSGLRGALSLALVLSLPEALTQHDLLTDSVYGIL